MSDQQQPDVRWAPLEPKPKNTGRVWLIVGLVIAALVVVGVLLFFLLPRDGAPEPGASGTPTPSETSPEPELTAPPVTEAPEPVEPSLEEFQGRVGFWLEDASRGLDIVSTNTGQDAVAVVETLQGDAQRLSESQPPASVSDEWQKASAAYGASLDELHTVASAGTDTADAVEEARTRLQELSAVIGL